MVTYSSNVFNRWRRNRGNRGASLEALFWSIAEMVIER